MFLVVASRQREQGGSDDDVTSFSSSFCFASLPAFLLLPLLPLPRLFPLPTHFLDDDDDDELFVLKMSSFPFYDPKSSSSVEIVI